jgi:hypothetical protein
LRCSQGGDHPQKGLAKFGYKSIIKVKTSKHPFYIVGYVPECDIKIWQLL